MSGRVGVVYDRVAFRKKSCTAVGRALSGTLGDRDLPLNLPWWEPTIRLEEWLLVR